MSVTPRLIPDHECAQGKCGCTTTGCWGVCSMKLRPVIYATLPAAPAPTEQAELPPADFEEWAATKYPLAIQNHSLGAYARGMKQCAKEGWDAALAARQAPTGPAAHEATLRDWLNIIHDNELSLGDRLQRISCRIGELLAGESEGKYPPYVIREQQASAADYEEVMSDHRRLVRELDVALNGEAGAAKQASLCDLVAQVTRQAPDAGKDADRLNWFADWFCRGGARSEIHPTGHMEHTTREIVFANIDAAILVGKAQ